MSIWRKNPLAAFLMLVSATMLVLLCGTLYRQVGNNNGIFEACFMFASCLLIALACKKQKIPYEVLRNWLAWTGFLLAVLILVGGLSGTISFVKYILLIGMFSFLPLFIFLLRASRLLESFLGMFSLVVAVLGAVSIVLWLAGPIFGIIDPNCSIENTFNWEHKSRMCDGYFGLLYVTQEFDVSSLKIARNTGIFLEAPAYALPLIMAFCFEVLFREKTRRGVACIIVVTAITTTSTIGIVGCLVVLFTKACLFSPGIKRNTSLIALVGIPLVLLCGALVVMRLQTESGLARIDDYVAGYRTWIQSPVWGNGFGDIDSVIRQHMSSARWFNQGTASALVQVLATGGLALLSIYAIGFASFIRSRDVIMKLFGAILLVFFCISGIWEIWLVVFAISIGIEDVLRGERRREAAAERRAAYWKHLISN